MSEYFDRLEMQLRGAAERPPRRFGTWSGAARRTAVGLAIVLATAVALVPAAALLGGGGSDRAVREGQQTDGSESLPVGTVIPAGDGTPPREVDHIVVATGTAPVAGPWRMEAYESTRLTDPETREEYQPAGLPCLGIALLDPPVVPPGADRPLSPMAGQCGEFPRTPGFGRSQLTVPSEAGQPQEILVYGRVPEGAAAVEATAAGNVQARVEPFPGPAGVPGDFYLLAVPADLEDGRVNWRDAEGNEGSRGIELLPP